ncbi:MAG: DUF6285 domain-containing protein [Micropepsaceae bacterium]
MMDQPSAVEIIGAVREFIEKQAIPQLTGRTAFHARVAANALAIVARELEKAPQAHNAELKTLQLLLGTSGTLEELNREFCKRIKSGELDFADGKIATHLISSTLAKVEIDQPAYSGFVHSQHRTP